MKNDLLIKKYREVAECLGGDLIFKQLNIGSLTQKYLIEIIYSIDHAKYTDEKINLRSDLLATCLVHPNCFQIPYINEVLTKHNESFVQRDCDTVRTIKSPSPLIKQDKKKKKTNILIDLFLIKTFFIYGDNETLVHDKLSSLNDGNKPKTIKKDYSEWRNSESGKQICDWYIYLVLDSCLQQLEEKKPNSHASSPVFCEELKRLKEKYKYSYNELGLLFTGQAKN